MIQVVIAPELAEGDHERAHGCVGGGLFEDSCAITQSIPDGIPVEVRIKGYQ